MSVTRRSFLKSGAISVLATAALVGAAPAVFGQVGTRPDPALDFRVPFEAQQSPLFYFRRETFQPYIGGTFRVSAGARSVNMTLQSVRDCTPGPENKSTPKSRPTDCFALVFRANGKLTDLTTIYDVEHGALGKFALFMTRRDGPRGTYFYEAVYNRVL
ncbi:MAG TPA: hypothetical protein VF611_09075 [Pyrinomonadaceae bacterium]|jgi:hypothetical protein